MNPDDVLGAPLLVTSHNSAMQTYESSRDGQWACATSFRACTDFMITMRQKGVWAHKGLDQNRLS